MEPRELYGVPNGDRDHVGATIRGGAIVGGSGRSVLWCSSALVDERRAEEGRVAHRDAIGMERDVWGASGASRRRRWRLERDKARG